VFNEFGSEERISVTSSGNNIVIEDHSIEANFGFDLMKTSNILSTKWREK